MVAAAVQNQEADGTPRRCHEACELRELEVEEEEEEGEVDEKQENVHQGRWFQTILVVKTKATPPKESRTPTCRYTKNVS